MNRRTLLQSSLAAAFGAPLLAAFKDERWADAVEILEKSTASSQIASAVLHVVHRGESYTRAFGKASSADAMFLLGSITKPICVTALMTLFDRGDFALDDPLKKFLPQFVGDGRERLTIQHLLTHVSGLPDQLPE